MDLDEIIKSYNAKKSLYQEFKLAGIKILK